MDVDSPMESEVDHGHAVQSRDGPLLQATTMEREQLEEHPQQVQQSPVAGPKPAPTYSIVNAIIGKEEDGPGPRCGHTLTAVTAVGEEGAAGYIGPRLILFGGATALEGNPAASGPQIRMLFYTLIC